jgi:glucose dehydrogenase
MDHHLYALDSENGDLLWKSDDLGGALAASPEFGADGAIFVGTSGNQILALDAETGQTRWAYDSEGWIWSGAALEQGTLYFGDLDGYLYAIDAETGSEMWKIKSTGAIVNKPLVMNGRIYYTTETPTFFAVDLEGAPVWQRDATAKVYSPITAIGETLIVASTDLKNPINAYNENGDQKWSFTFEDK